MGVCLVRKHIPVADYLANIRNAYVKMPTLGRVKRARDSKISPAWKMRYVCLVNAFGWNAGRTSKFIPAGLEGFYLPPEQEAMVAVPLPMVTVCADRNPTGGGVTVSLMRDIRARLATYPYTFDRTKCCARRVGKRAQVTKAFPTRQDLFRWVADTYAHAWDRVLKAKAPA